MIDKIKLRNLILKLKKEKDEAVLTHKQFTDNFAKVLNFLKKLKEKNSTNVESLTLKTAEASKKLKADNFINFSGLNSKISKIFDKLLKDQEDGMNFIRDKVRNLKGGKNGKDADEKKIVKRVLKKIISPEQKETILDTPIQIADKLETLPEEESLKIKAILGLEKRLKDLEERPIGRGRVGGARKVTYIKRVNLTDQCDGATKEFTLPNDTIEVIGVFGTQFPINFNPGTDWTFEGRTLTLTSEVGAPQSGQTLYALVETLFYG